MTEAANILAKDILAKTETGARVAVMCDPEAVIMFLVIPRVSSAN